MSFGEGIVVKELREEIDNLLRSIGYNDPKIEKIQNENATASFSAENRLLAYLLSIGKISFEDYSRIADEFTKRQSQKDKYITLFDMAPRTFGQTWGEQYIKSLFPEFLKATKENLAGIYPDFDGEFDLWIDGIRVEVKACRANSTATKGSLASRAYSHEEAKNAGFKYHYQQLKPSCCDVFIWIGVCKDDLLYWVMTSEELQKTGKLGSQHRNENTGVACFYNLDNFT